MSLIYAQKRLSICTAGNISPYSTSSRPPPGRRNSGLHGHSVAGTEDTWVGLCQWSFFAMEFNIEDYQADSSRVLINTLMNSKVKKNDNLTLSLLRSVNRKVFNSNFILEPVCQTYILLLCCYRMSTFFIFWSMLFLHLGISYCRSQTLVWIALTWLSYSEGMKHTSVCYSLQTSQLLLKEPVSWVRQWKLSF